VSYSGRIAVVISGLIYHEQSGEIFERLRFSPRNELWDKPVSHCFEENRYCVLVARASFKQSSNETADPVAMQKADEKQHLVHRRFFVYQRALELQ